jgi:predicted RNase H-like HicB family nuclease
LLSGLTGSRIDRRTREEVEQNMQETVELHLEGLLEVGYPVPEPSTSSAYVDVTA